MSATLMDVLTTTAELLQLDEVADMLAHYGEYSDGEDDRKQDTRLDTDPDGMLLTAAAKTAVYEIANDGFPAVDTVTAAAKGGLIPMEEIGGNVLYVISVAKGGGIVRFTTTPYGVKVGSDGEYVVTYCIRIGEIGYYDDIKTDLAPPYVVAYRAARNYCLMTGRTDEASIWDGRYAEEAEKLRVRRRSHLPRRRWV